MSPSRARQRDTPFDNPVARFLAGRFGLGLFLASLGMLFVAMILGFAVIRFQLRDLWPRDLPPLPRLLWVSTAVLLLSSLVLQWALNGIRADRPDRLLLGMFMTTALGFAFLVLQSVSWWDWLAVVNEHWAISGEYRFALTSFYVLTGLHALHVVGGLIPMVVVTHAALRHRYTAQGHAGVVYTAMYWHFLGGVWIILYATLLIGK